MLDSFGFFDGHILGFADGNGTKVQVMNLKQGRLALAAAHILLKVPREVSSVTTKSVRFKDPISTCG